MCFEWFICAILFYFEHLPWLVGPALSDTVRVGPLGSQVANCGSQMVDEEVHKVKDEVMDMVGDVMNMAKEVATITKDTLAERLTILSRRWPTPSFFESKLTSVYASSKGRPFWVDAPYIWALPVWGGV